VTANRKSIAGGLTALKVTVAVLYNANNRFPELVDNSPENRISGDFFPAGEQAYSGNKEEDKEL